MIDLDLVCALIALTTASAPFILIISLAQSGFLNVKAVTELENAAQELQKKNSETNRRAARATSGWEKCLIRASMTSSWTLS